MSVAPTDERFKELIGTIDAIVSEYDLRAGRFTYVSEQAERILGYPPGLLEDDCQTWLARIHEDDRRMIEAVTAQALADRMDQPTSIGSAPQALVAKVRDVLDAG